MLFSWFLNLLLYPSLQQGREISYRAANSNEFWPLASGAPAPQRVDGDTERDGDLGFRNHLGNEALPFGHG
jgi:hypothetical protein